MNEAVHFGAGNIGRGFLGQLYFESGYRTTFVDVVDEVVEALQRRGSYPLRLVEDTEETLTIENVGAVHGRDVEAVAGIVARADIVSTAVGVPILPRIAPALAKGIERRFADANAAPLNIIVCENLIDAGPYLRNEIRKHLDAAFHDILESSVGLVEASIGRMVPVMTEAQKAEDLLLVCVEPYCELPVDGQGFKGAIPEIAHMKALPKFKAYVERKLFVHNMTHAVTAYAGYLRGHEFIWQAIRDAKVLALVEGAGRESCAALARKHGLDTETLETHRQDLLRRYHNRALGDQVARVARDPLRKLSVNDRLIGAARLCLEQSLPLEHIAVAIAAALRYAAPDDPASAQLQAVRAERGDAGALAEFSGVAPGSALSSAVLDAAKRLVEHGLG